MCRENLNFYENLTIITGALRGDLGTFMIISRRIVLRMRNVPNKGRENQSTHFIFSNSFCENRAVYEMVWKNV
jgi:hypothetical protein